MVGSQRYDPPRELEVGHSPLRGVARYGYPNGTAVIAAQRGPWDFSPYRWGCCCAGLSEGQGVPLCGPLQCTKLLQSGKTRSVLQSLLLGPHPSGSRSFPYQNLAWSQSSPWTFITIGLAYGFKSSSSSLTLIDPGVPVKYADTLVRHWPRLAILGHFGRKRER